MLLSIIIPAYNEEKRIANTICRIKEFCEKEKIKTEIIVVDDGSTDQTVEICRNFAEVNILSNTKNMGKGYAVKKGILAASGDYLLYTDADLSTPISEIKFFFPYLYDGYDLVLASRNLPQSSKEIPQSLIREICGHLFRSISRRLVISGFSDTQCGFKMFRSPAAKKIFSLTKINGFAFDLEVLYLAKKLNFKIKEVAVVWINNSFSKLSLHRHTLPMLFDLFKITSLHQNDENKN